VSGNGKAMGEGHFDPSSWWEFS